MLEEQKSQYNQRMVMDFFGSHSIYFDNSSPIDFWQQIKRIGDVYSTNQERYPSKIALMQQIDRFKKRMKTGFTYHDAFVICYSQALIDSNSDVNAILNGTAINNNKSSNSASSSNQTSSSGFSNQSSKKANQQTTNSQSNQSNNSNNSSTSSQIQSNSQSNAGQTSTETYSDLDMSPEQAVLVREAAQTYTAKNAAFEESHKGLRRTHKKEDVATKCLIMEGKHLKNTCDFRVEYTFCAYKPDREAFKAAFEMAAAFDCEQRKFGSSGLPAKRRDAGSFTAEALYVFGCKDPSLPRGVTYERGRGIFGRCAE